MKSMISMLLEHAKTYYNTCYIWYFSMPGTGNHRKSWNLMKMKKIHENYAFLA